MCTDDDDFFRACFASNLGLYISHNPIISFKILTQYPVAKILKYLFNITCRLLKFFVPDGISLTNIPGKGFYMPLETVTNFNLIFGERPAAQLRDQRVRRIRQVPFRVDQRPIQVEDDETGRHAADGGW